MERYENIDNYIMPKTVYGYWDNLDGNRIIEAHLNTWRRNIPSDWNIVIITKKNVNEYVDNDFLENFKNLPSFRFADYLRLYLLIKNGGAWLDLGSIVIDGHFLNDYYEEMIENKYDVCLYELDVRTVEKDKPYLENWFIMAPKDSIFLKDLYDEFVKSYTMGFLNYKKNVIMPCNFSLEKTLGYNDSTYLMQHGIMHYLFHQKKEYKINIKEAYESMFKVQKITDWKADKIINYIINNDDWTGYYVIKLTGDNRKGITENNIDDYIEKINSF
jgi:hypothetical protein